MSRKQDDRLDRLMRQNRLFFRVITWGSILGALCAIGYGIATYPTCRDDEITVRKAWGGFACAKGHD